MFVMHREVLLNSYYCLTVENWNQTLRKIKDFTKTWDSKKIRTQRNGYYGDMILGISHQWERGIIPMDTEIMALKLYTDWSDLQYQLKMCFRSEDTELSLHIHPKKMDDNLMNRLSEFYHWRGALLLFIHKFSSTLDRAKTLFVGVNRKMILDPSATHSFFGPLSTTSSFYVARNFASEQGMILEISSMYPRLGMCNAFNASLVSEYPEEQEYLVGHIYLRINQIHIKEPPEYIHIDSKLRLAFFTIHLFQRQIFSMDSYLVQYLVAFIEFQLFNVL